jgi:hypothetical protein
MAVNFNFYTTFSGHFKSFKNVATSMSVKNIDISVKCQNHAFYDKSEGIFVPIVVENLVMGYVTYAFPPGQLDNFVVFDEATVANCAENNTLKLLPQTVKMLTSVSSAGSRLSVNSYARTHETVSLKLRSQEVLKAVILGYLKFFDGEEMISLLGRNATGYAISQLPKGTPLAKKAALVHAAFTDPKKVEAWDCKVISDNLGNMLVRTAKMFDKDHVLKWRKPPKNSVWPYTLDHHWFEVQESPISLANYTFKALLAGNHSYNKSEKIDNQYPIFSKKLNLEHGRKILESFFQDALTNRKNHAWTNVVHQVNNMRWNTDNPCYSIPKLCLVLGVVPKFNAAGQFVKFVPAQNNLKLPSKKLFIEFNSINIDQSTDLSPFLLATLVFGYELGLVPLNAIEQNFGILNAGAAFDANPNYTKVPLGDNVICCISKTFSYDIANAALAKYNAKTLSKKEETVESSAY